MTAMKTKYCVWRWAGKPNKDVYDGGKRSASFYQQSRVAEHISSCPAFTNGLACCGSWTVYAILTVNLMELPITTVTLHPFQSPGFFFSHQLLLSWGSFLAESPMEVSFSGVGLSSMAATFFFHFWLWKCIKVKNNTELLRGSIAVRTPQLECGTVQDRPHLCRQFPGRHCHLRVALHLRTRSSWDS